MTISTTYFGERVLTFESGRHVYKLDGVKIPSVTGITKILAPTDILMGWAVKECALYVEHNIQRIDTDDPVALKDFLRQAKRAHRDNRDKAADIGTIVHEWLEAYFTAKTLERGQPLLPKNKHAEKACQGFLERVQDLGDVQVNGLEQKCLYIGDISYAGTFDADLTIIKDGVQRRVLADWKTSNRLDPAFRIQLGGYTRAQGQTRGIDYDSTMIVRCDRETGEVQIEEWTDTQEGERLFESAALLSDWLAKNRS